jgi:hypothetical protein
MATLEKKYLASLQDGGLNTDDADFAVPTNQVIAGQNVRWGSTDEGRTSVVEDIGGTRQISEAQPSVTFLTLGTAEDVENNRLIFFKFNTTGIWHRITCYDKTADTEYIVLYSSQVVGGLKFSRYSPIHSARVINGLLYWTDFEDTQHKVNIDAGIKLNQPSYVTDQAAYTTPIEIETISLIKRPPRLPLNVEKAVETVVTNFIGNNTFWFAYRYFYRDKETSVISVHSDVVGYNAEGDTFNAVIVTLPLGEKIDQDVERVEVGVRIDNNPQFFGIKTWDKLIAAEAAEIAAHNAGTTPLSFDFFNNFLGFPWGDAYSVKYAESCPVRSKTLEFVRGRIHLANNYDGYDTPTETSLQITDFTQVEGAAITGQWYRYDYAILPDLSTTFNINILLIEGMPASNGYYTDGGYTPGVPGDIDYTLLTYIGTTVGDIENFVGGNVVTINLGILAFSNPVINAPGATVTLINNRVYKTGANYKFGIQFYDEYDRKCGVVTAASLILETPETEYDNDTFSTAANWQLSNSNAEAQIPVWAKSYAIVRTKCLLTRQFVQARVSDLKYAVLNPTTGVYTFTTTAYAATLDGVAIRISALQTFGIGYLYEEGNNDFVRLYIDSAPASSGRIIAQQEDWVVIQLLNLGALTGTPKTDAYFEIIRPYTQLANEPFYEVGNKYLINNYGTGIRAFSVTSGSIGGDVYVLERTDGIGTYLVEAMSVNDRYWFNWFDQSGRIGLVLRVGQVYKPNSIKFSNTFILGSNLNGLCEFEALNEDFVPYECGQIQKLQVTSKVQNEQGAIMLAVCQIQTASIYIGETQIVSPTGNAFFAQSSGVIGTINVLKGDFGTVDPQSVVEYRGQVFWLDAGNGKVIQYSSNGLFPISAYKMTRFWRYFCETYVSMTKAEIEALGSRPFVVTTVDPHHDEVLFTIPKLLADPPAGYLPDYPSEIYPFDIWDGQAKTMVFKLGVGEGRPYWQPPQTATPEWWAKLQNDLYSSKNGIIWQHNQQGRNTFYGVQYKSRVCVVANAAASAIKVFQAISIEANRPPDWVYMMCSEPFPQISDLLSDEFRNTEGVYYCTIRRNKIRETATGVEYDNLLTGDRMRSFAMKILFEFSPNNLPLNIRFLNITFDASKGHSNYQ